MITKGLSLALFNLLLVYHVSTTQVLYNYKEMAEVSTYKIGFGSCFNGQNKVADIFKDVIEENLNLWVWLGDFAYADYKLNSEKLRPNLAQVF